MAVRPFPIAILLLTLPTAAAPAFAAGCKVGKIAELAVTMNGMRPMITAKINGVDAQFIADSGAFFSLIAPASAAEYKLRTRPAPFHLMLQGVGGVTEAEVTTVKEFTLAGVPLHNIEFVVGGSQPGGGSVGLLGQNVLRIADVEYDLSNGAIRLMKPDGCSKTNMAYWAKEGDAYSVIDIAWATAGSPHTTGTAYINGAKIRVLFDTGAATSVLNLRAAERAGVKPESPGVIKAGYSHGIGSRSIQTWIGPFDSFKIGDEEVRHTKLRIGDLSHTDADMLVGADFFLSHRVYVASTQRKLYFTYNGGPVFNLMSVPPGLTASAAPPDADAEAEAKSSEPAASGSTPTNSAAVPVASVAPTTEASAAGAGDDSTSEPGNDFGPPPTAAGPPPPIPTDEPTDAGGFARRGAAFAARREFQRAIADLTRACELAPTEPDYFAQRGRMRLASRQPILAMSDFDQALKLKPDHVPALMMRGSMRLALQDAAGHHEALVDLDKVNATVAKESDVRLALGGLYARGDAVSQALEQFTLWIDKHPSDARAAEAFNARCRVRAVQGMDLDKALSDCNRAVRARPESPPFLDSRGIVYLRLGNFDKALADYEAVVRLQPRNPSGLYGRGIARLRKGMKAEGEADIAASKAISPRIAQQAAAHGIAP